MEFQLSYSKSWRWCCESAALSMPANLENSAVATGLGKVSFHLYPKQRQCQRMFKLPQTPWHCIITWLLSPNPNRGFSLRRFINYLFVKFSNHSVWVCYLVCFRKSLIHKTTCQLSVNPFFHWSLAYRGGGTASEMIRLNREQGRIWGGISCFLLETRCQHQDDSSGVVLLNHLEMSSRHSRRLRRSTFHPERTGKLGDEKSCV